MHGAFALPLCDPKSHMRPLPHLGFSEVFEPEHDGICDTKAGENGSCGASWFGFHIFTPSTAREGCKQHHVRSPTSKPQPPNSTFLQM